MNNIYMLKRLMCLEHLEVVFGIINYQQGLNASKAGSNKLIAMYTNTIARCLRNINSQRQFPIYDIMLRPGK